MVERNFLEVVKKIENKRKEKKNQLDRVLKERAEQDAEEKKHLRTKIKILKEAFNKANEQVQSAQVLEKDLETKMKECESLKLQLKRLSVPFAPVTNSPRNDGSTAPSGQDPIVLTGTNKGTPIIVGTANSFSRVKSMKWGTSVPPPSGSNETTPKESLPPVLEAPAIFVQGSSPRNNTTAISPTGQPPASSTSWTFKRKEG